MSRPITHLIYDFDGLLMDTEPIHWQVNTTLAKRYNRRFDLETHLAIIGRPALVSAQIIVDRLGLPLTATAYLDERDAIIFDLYPQAKPMPGALALTQHFYQAGIPQAIATSSDAHRFERKISNHPDWLDRFACVVTGDDPAIAQGKPAPDCFLITAERLKTTPDRCLVFEDSVAGVRAAKRAGMAVIAIPSPELSRSHFQMADLILDSLLEFQPTAWGLPAN